MSMRKNKFPKIPTDSPDHPPKYVWNSTMPSLTEQQFKEDCELKTILAKYGQARNVPDMAPGTPVWGDFTQANSMADALAQIGEANEQFMQLPPDIRRALNHDPARLVELLEAAERGDEQAIAYGKHAGIFDVRGMAPEVKPDATPPTPAPAAPQEPPPAE